MALPYTLNVFGNATGNLSLSLLDNNFTNVASYSTNSGYVIGNVQGNINSVGPLTGLRVNGTTTIVNLNGAGLVIQANIANVSSPAIMADGNIIQTSGNISGANVIRAGGNIIAGGYFVGDGTFITNVSGSYGNANVATYLSSGAITGNITTTGNVNVGNNITVKNITSTGNISTHDITQAGNLSITGYANISGNINALSNVIVSANALIGGNSNIVGNVNIDGDLLVDNIQPLTQTLTIGGNILTDTADVYNIGSPTTPFGNSWVTNGVNGGYFTGASESIAGGDTLSIFTTASYFDVAGTETATLPNGNEGQFKTLICTSVAGGNMTVTVTNNYWGGAGTIFFDTPGQACTLQFVNGAWACVGNNGAVFA